MYELIHQGDCGTSVYVVVSIYQNTLFMPQCLIQPVYGNIHVGVQERVVKVGQLWSEKAFCLRNGTNVPVQEKLAKYWADSQFIG